MNGPVIIGDATLYPGDCLEILPTLPAGSVDSVVTDSPYGLGFMGKDWDHGVPGVHFWMEILRVAKPGAYLLAFGGTRTYHRLACAIEDAGFEIRDQIQWLYGSGFPKSLDVSKAIDAHACRWYLTTTLGREPTKAEFKAAWKEWRKIVGMAKGAGMSKAVSSVGTFRDDVWQPQGPDLPITIPATPSAAQWQGWGTALKPAHEPIVVARKPLEGTVAANVLAHGTGGLNIDGCRVETTDQLQSLDGSFSFAGSGGANEKGKKIVIRDAGLGRWPANVCHDGSEEVVGLFPQTQGGTWNRTDGARHFNNDGEPTHYQTSGSDKSRGSAARFFYCAKASKADRDEGLEGIELKPVLIGAEGHKINPMTGKPVVDIPRANHHPTVKPTALMRWLVRLVTPPGGIVLDPFMGSGSTGKACAKEGFRFVGIELDADYFEIARRRIEYAQKQAVTPITDDPAGNTGRKAFF